MRIDLTISDRRPQKSVLAALGPSNTGNFDIAMDGLGYAKLNVCGWKNLFLNNRHINRVNTRY